MLSLQPVTTDQFRRAGRILSPADSTFRARPPVRRRARAPSYISFFSETLVTFFYLVVFQGRTRAGGPENFRRPEKFFFPKNKIFFPKK